MLAGRRWEEEGEERRGRGEGEDECIPRGGGETMANKEAERQENEDVTVVTGEAL